MDDCVKSKNWETPEAGNSWTEAILNEIGNLLNDKRKCRICFGGHHMTAGVHFERTEAYAPVPSWTAIKLQLVITAKHRFGLRAFDCTAAYLQAELKKPLDARPPKGLISVLQKEMGGL